jgi:predicted RNA binding protein with dsRBD fold (UPF0201 family)
MPCAQVECQFCKKSIRSDKYAAHCISNHIDTIIDAMPARRKKSIMEDLKVPLITIYNEAKNPGMTMCLNCKKYCNKDSERNRNTKTFSYAHKRSECAKSFDTYKSLFEISETEEVPESPVHEDDELTAIKNVVDELLPQEEDEDATISERICNGLKSQKKLIGILRKQKAELQSEIERLKAELEDCKKSQATIEHVEFVDKSQDLLWDLRNDIKNKNKDNYDVFAESIVSYNKYEYKSLHDMYEEYISECAEWE